MTRRRKIFIGALAAGVITLATVDVRSLAYPDYAAAEAYHEQVRVVWQKMSEKAQAESPEAVADGKPVTVLPLVGDLQGRSVPLTAAAIELLLPNVQISGQYQYRFAGLGGTGPTESPVHFMLIQSREVTSMQGHYPPNCYRNQGQSLVGKKPRQWEVATAGGGTMTVAGTEYLFKEAGDEPRSWVVYNFMILPTGRIERDMESLNEAANQPTYRPLGAAQVQLVMPASMTVERRDEIFVQLVGAYSGLIETIRKGAKL